MALVLAVAMLTGGGLHAQQPTGPESAPNQSGGKTVESVQRQKKAAQKQAEAKPEAKPKSERGDKEGAPAKKDGLTLVGSLGTNITASWSSGVYNSSPFSIFSYANFILGYNELSVPVYFNYANVAAPGLLKDPRSSLGQATYMYGATPMWRKWKAHLGYSSMKFSQYTLHGMQFIGGGLEFNGRYLHFAGFGGYMNMETQMKQKNALRSASSTSM